MIKDIQYIVYMGVFFTFTTADFLTESIVDFTLSLPYKPPKRTPKSHLKSLKINFSKY